VLVGVCNAVGGGILRDVLVREEPVMLKPGQLNALAALAGCVLFTAMSYRYGIDVEYSAWAAIALTVMLRLLAVRFDWKTGAFGRWWARRKDG
jgi:uncharacterized membrane protein YeiH